MNRTMFKSKIHRASVTHADLHYVGSVTVDLDLLDAADILPGELVAIVDVTNGARLETYTIAGERGSGVIGINGAAAHVVHENDIVILITYAEMTTHEARSYEPRVVHVDQNNKVIQLGKDPAEGLTPGLLRPPYALNNAAIEGSRALVPSAAYAWSWGHDVPIQQPPSSTSTPCTQPPSRRTLHRISSENLQKRDSPVFRWHRLQGGSTVSPFMLRLGSGEGACA